MDVEEKWTMFVCSEMWLSGGPFRLKKIKRWSDSVACQLLIFFLADLPQVFFFYSSQHVEIIDGERHSPISRAVDLANKWFLEYPPRDGKILRGSLTVFFFFFRPKKLSIRSRTYYFPKQTAKNVSDKIYVLENSS